MLSRVADRIFWMSRQMERAENMARILGVTSNMVLFGNKDTREQNLLAPLTITGTAEAYFERAKPLLDQMCRRVERCGPVGAGATMKLAVNLPLIVFDMNKPGNLGRIVTGEPIGTLVEA